MNRVKTVKQVGVGQSLLLAGFVMMSVGAQASVSPGGNIQVAGSLIISSPVTPPASVSWPVFNYVNSPSASSSVSGSMNYYTATSSGAFNESDSSQQGAQLDLELNRKGFGYRARAMSETGKAHAHAETQWTQENVSGNSSASANATWSDWFVISGGTGLGSASFSSLLDGTMASAKYGSAGYSLNIGYSTNDYCYYWNNSCSEAEQRQTLFSQTSSLYGKSTSTLSQVIEGEFTFAYNKPFQLTASLNSHATNGGLADFTLTSLGSSLVLPAGANLLSSSGLYVQAVPEAETYAMMLAGLGLVGFAAARRRATSK